ncbi:hypothetical protein L7F22_041205 [Adiantum nelumboides]|nr:hypothetical protein [Adiantum nelumboides]
MELLPGHGQKRPPAHSSLARQATGKAGQKRPPAPLSSPQLVAKEPAPGNEQEWAKALARPLISYEQEVTGRTGKKRLPNI